jgi:hypothetical protein
VALTLREIYFDCCRTPRSRTTSASPTSTSRSPAARSRRLYPGEVPADTGPTRDDLTAAVGARRELGPDYEDAVLDGFLARLDRQMQERVDATVAERSRRTTLYPGERDPGLTLGIVSVIAGIPVTAITTGTEELAALIVAWGGIAAVNVAHAWGRRRRHTG